MSRRFLRNRTWAILLGLTLGAIPTSGALYWRSLARENAARPQFGFQAYYELPRERADDRCGTDNGGPTSWPWVEGPHARFDELAPERLALESLAWFHGSSEAGAWRENSSARLELIYPSASLKLTARHAPGLDLSWEEQIQTWFERFPPDGEACSDSDNEPYRWRVSFGNRGEVRGSAASDSTALEGMKSCLRNERPSALFLLPDCSLSLGVRRSPHEMDCYAVHADTLDQLDELPLRLREKHAGN